VIYAASVAGVAGAQFLTAEPVWGQCAGAPMWPERALFGPFKTKLLLWPTQEQKRDDGSNIRIA